MFSKFTELADLLSSQGNGIIAVTEVHLILPVTKDRLSSLLKTQNDINFGLAKTSVKPKYTFWIIFILDLALSYTDKLLVFRWVLIVLPL